ncbi:MAG: pyruvate formate lyase family protein [Evtepia gabavorous]
MWTISANTADYFAGYNQFQNLTVGGKRRDGKDGTNPVTYLALKATEEVKTHQPGLSVRVQADCPRISGRGDPPGVQRHWVSAIHSDSVGYQMLLNAGYARRTPGLEQLRLRGAPLPEDGGVDCGGEHELWLCLGYALNEGRV